VLHPRGLGFICSFPAPTIRVDDELHSTAAGLFALPLPVSSPLRGRFTVISEPSLHLRDACRCDCTIRPCHSTATRPNHRLCAPPFHRNPAMDWQPSPDSLKQLAGFLKDSLSGFDKGAQKHAENVSWMAIDAARSLPPSSGC
jgi:hypothetical protein